MGIWLFAPLASFLGGGFKVACAAQPVVSGRPSNPCPFLLSGNDRSLVWLCWAWTDGGPAITSRVLLSFLAVFLYATYISVNSSFAEPPSHHPSLSQVPPGD